jgi:hypothetical protein
MENNDFDIFELFKILVKQRVKLFAFFLLFFVLLFAYQFTLPIKYSANFTASSNVLQQTEILVKVMQIQNLLDNGAYKQLAEALDLSLVQAESIDFIDAASVKNDNYLVDITVSASNAELLYVFEQKFQDFIAQDSKLWIRKELKKDQLTYALQKLNEELDSLKVMQEVKGVFIAAQEQNLIELIDKKKSVETEIAVFTLFNVYEGYEIIKHKASLPIQLMSSGLLAFVLSIIFILVSHFYKVLKARVEA